MLEVILPQIYPLSNYHVIIANGRFPADKHLIKMIHEAQSIICCDGAVSKLLKQTICPDHIIGDCDSLPREIKQYFADRIIIIPDQNTNDLTKAVNFAANTQKIKNIVVLGATGLREDHTIGNIALLSEYIEFVDEIALISEYGIFTAYTENTEIQTIPGQQISFFTLNPDTVINCDELKWPLKDFKLDLWNQGTLNQALNSKINLRINGIAIVYRAFETKE